MRSAALGTSKWEPTKRAFRRARRKRFPTDILKLADLDPVKHLPFFCTLRGSLSGPDSDEHQERLIVHHGTSRGNMHYLTNYLRCGHGHFLFSTTAKTLTENKANRVRWVVQVFAQTCLPDVPSLRVREGHSLCPVGDSSPERQAQALVQAYVEQRYASVLCQLRRTLLVAELVQTHHLEAAHFDFEPGSVGAFTTSFPGVPTKMCTFHLAQAVNRRVSFVKKILTG